jgi:hypothetical protein
LLHDPAGAGREQLASDVRRMLEENARGTSKAFPARGLDEASRRAWDAIVRASAPKEPKPRALEDLLATTSPRLLVALLPKTVINDAIRTHLIHMWKNELGRVEPRAPHSFIRLCDRSGNENYGYVDKRAFHDERRNLRANLNTNARARSLWQMHVAGLVFTADGRRIVLRRRLGEGNRYDQRKWDRAVVGHVRMHSNWEQELRLEVRHHFNRAPCWIEQCDLKPLDVFLSELRARTFRRRNATPNTMLVAQMTDTEVEGTYRRSIEGTSSTVTEHTLTRPYVCLLPGEQLPDVTNNNHAIQWAELPISAVGKLTGKHDIRVRSPVRVHPRDNVQVIRFEECTEELIQLLTELLAKIELPNARTRSKLRSGKTSASSGKRTRKRS